MKRKQNLVLSAITVLAILVSSSAAQAGIVIGTKSPLYKYSFDSNGQPLNKFIIDYPTLAAYYAQVAGNILQPNISSKAILLKDGTVCKTPREELLFQVNLRKMTITPLEPLAPESAQELFNFNVDAYVAENPGKDFVTAKKDAFARLNFDKESQHFDRDYLHMSDWKSLNHPPVKQIDNNDRYYKTDNEIPADSKMLTAEFNQELDTASGSELTSGNKLKLLVNNESFKEKMKQIHGAKKSILVALMSFASDPSSKSMIDALIEKRKEGLDVQVILEKLWTSTVFRPSLKRLTEGGVRLMLADDMYHVSPKRRTLLHNKIWIFDEQTVIMGGQNIVNSSNNSTGFNHWNKDTDVLIEGPMVTDVLREFVVLKQRYDKRLSPRKNKQFNLNTGESADHYSAIVEKRTAEERAAGLRGSENYATWFSKPETALNGACRFVIQGPQRDENALSKAYVRYFGSAKNQIFFVSQHIEYDTNLSPETSSWETEIYRTIFERGRSSDKVQIDLIANGIDGGFAEIGQNIVSGEKSERRKRTLEKKYARQEARGEEPGTFMTKLSSRLGINATKKFAGFLDSAAQHEGFNAWMHFQYIHSKTVLIDNVMASVGSFNFEPYSAESSHESSIFCYDQGLVKDLKADLVRDIVNSTPVFPGKMLKLTH